jgi:hypothetical protein
MEEVVDADAWVIDDVSLPEDGECSPGVARQYCGALGKTANCQVLPSVHLVTDAASCPVNRRLFVPGSWDGHQVPGERAPQVAERRRRARIPADAGHVPKWQLAVDMLDELACWGLVPPLVAADEGNGQDGAFRLALAERGIADVVGVRADTALLPAGARRTVPTPRWACCATPGGASKPERPATCIAFAPDRRLIVAFMPEGDRFAPAISNWPSWEPLWVIRAYIHGELNEVVWEATFTSQTPVEFIAAFLVDLVRKTPLDPERDEPAPPTLTDQ